MHGPPYQSTVLFFSRHLRYLHTNMMFRYLIVRKRTAHALHLHFHTHHIHHEILVCLDKIHCGISFLLISYLTYRLFGILHVFFSFVNRIFMISSLFSKRPDLDEIPVRVCNIACPLSPRFRYRCENRLCSCFQHSLILPVHVFIGRQIKGKLHRPIYFFRIALCHVPVYLFKFFFSSNTRSSARHLGSMTIAWLPKLKIHCFMLS